MPGGPRILLRPFHMQSVEITKEVVDERLRELIER
jgi:hypothetical protein